MTRELLVAGGGIGGLAAALAARRAGWEARVLEQADVFAEAGAGIQLGPNVTRILREWGLLAGELMKQACQPRALRVRDAVNGRDLAQLDLGDFEQRYGAPYLTVHRADLHAALLRAAQGAGARLHAGRKVRTITAFETGVRVQPEEGPEVEAEALVGADGLWSTVRGFVAGVEPARATGHLAYRGLLRCPGVDEVSVWLAPSMHLVTYPVRGGEWLNVVCVVAGQVPRDPRGWDHVAVAANLQPSLAGIAAEARELLRAVPEWRLWALHDRASVTGADALVRGRVALLGDAAHPMLPYLAQGAGMAIEDARALQQVLTMTDEGVVEVPAALQRYGLGRWQRVAKVQAKSRRNGEIFHAGGLVRAGRNVALRALGRVLLDQGWLYRG